MNTSMPSAERHHQLIAKYFIPSMGRYSDVGGELSPILERLDNQALTSTDKQWIRDKGLFDLCKFVEKLESTGKADFKILNANFNLQQKKNIRAELWQEFNINYIESPHVHQMVTILLCLHKGNRLSEKDVLWLSTNNYFFDYPQIKLQFHKIEALFYRDCFENNHVMDQHLRRV